MQRLMFVALAPVVFFAGAATAPAQTENGAYWWTGLYEVTKEEVKDYTLRLNAGMTSLIAVHYENQASTTVGLTVSVYDPKGKLLVSRVVHGARPLATDIIKFQSTEKGDYTVRLDLSGTPGTVQMFSNYAVRR